MSTSISCNLNMYSCSKTSSNSEPGHVNKSSYTEALQLVNIPTLASTLSSERFLSFRKENNIALCNISCYLLNARGLKSKLLDFEYEIVVIKQLPGMIFITETWLGNNCIISDIISEHFHVIRKDRNRNGGKVKLLVYKNF